MASLAIDFMGDGSLTTWFARRSTLGPSATVFEGMLCNVEQGLPIFPLRLQLKVPNDVPTRILQHDPGHLGSERRNEQVDPLMHGLP